MKREELKSLLWKMVKMGPKASTLVAVCSQPLGNQPPPVKSLVEENIPFQALVLQDSSAKTWEWPEDTLSALETYLS